jgi:hypothetical protein
VHLLAQLEARATAHPPVDLVVRIFPSAYGRDVAALHSELEQAVQQLLRRLA